MLLKVGDLAKRTGLTVRTLHHYDEIGLLQPTGRSEGNYRLYAADDVARLHAIQTLRGLGLALDEIGRLLDSGGADLQAIVARQLEALDAQIRSASELRQRLTMVQAKYAAGDQPGLEDWIATLSLMTTGARYFSAEEMRDIFGNWAAVEGRWQRLVTDVRAAMEVDAAPDTAQVQALAQRWMGLMHEWMGGDFDRMVRWGRMYDAEPALQKSGVTREVAAYVERAIRLRMEALHRHVGEAELRRLVPVPEREWQALTERVRALIAGGTPPSAPEAQAAAADWQLVVGRMCRGDAALAGRLAAAHAAEPLLRAGAMMPGDVRDYLWAAAKSGGSPDA
jgi:DNA-binding transcriptional MerR regulator